MIGISVVLFLVAILVFVGIFIYGLVRQRSISEKGRQVDVRVVSCEEKLVIDEVGNKLVYYLVTVDFFGLNGETIVRSISSRKGYKEGDVIRSRYLDKKDQLWLGADSLKGSITKSWMCIGFMVVFFIVVLLLFHVWNSGGDQMELFKTVFGYMISIIFLGIGILGIRKKMELKKPRQNMLVVEGTQVDYYCAKRREFGEANTYYPIYEFVWNGERRRYQSRFGSSGKKEQMIGRKVHMLIDPETGKITCREETQSSSSMYFIFGAFGLLVLCIMLAGTFGLL